MLTERTTGNFRTLYLKFDDVSTEKHVLFLKEHTVRNQEPEYPKGKTLFVLNIPLYVNLNSLTAAFSRHCGPVKFGKFQSRSGCAKTGFKVAYIVFSNDLALERALSLPENFTIVLNTGESLCTLGLQKWSKAYNAIFSQNETDLKDSIEKYMAGYDSRVEKKSTDENEEDDGWTTVSSKKKRGQFAPTRKESTIEKLQSVEERKKGKKQLLNFYTFQIRESKKNQLADLRKKFELDKRKLQQLKSRRTFKPFV